MENLISNTGVFGINVVQSPEIERLGDKFTGEGSAGNLIIIKKTDHSNNNQEFLKKVFQAVNLSLSSDCFLLELSPSEKIMLGPALRAHQIQNIIIFGVSNENLGMSLQLQRYQIASLETQKVLLADDLSDIQSNDKLKRLLWNSLKDLFKA